MGIRKYDLAFGILLFLSNIDLFCYFHLFKVTLLYFPLIFHLNVSLPFLLLEVLDYRLETIDHLELGPPDFELVQAHGSAPSILGGLEDGHSVLSF